MDQRIGMMEFLAERIAKRNARDLLPGHRIHHDKIVGKDGERTDRLDQAERLEHPEHVGPKLDAGTDFLEFRRLLDDLRGDTLARQRQRRRQPADAAADDDDLAVLPIAHARDSSTHIVKGNAFTTRLAQSAKSGDDRWLAAPSPLWGGMGWGSRGDAQASTKVTSLPTPTPAPPHKAEGKTTGGERKRSTHGRGHDRRAFPPRPAI